MSEINTSGRGVLQQTFNEDSLKGHCDHLAAIDPMFRKIIIDHGYPKIQLRSPRFETLVRLILEQQVSLLSAKAAWMKLVERITVVSPQNILVLSDEELRSCYFSRQKSRYVKILAQGFIDDKEILQKLTHLTDEEVRLRLIQFTGIGDWTAHNYLLFGLHRPDIFPIGDIALVNSLRKIKKLPAGFPKEQMIRMAECWRPFRSIATLLLWHAYIVDRKMDIEQLNYE